MKYKERILIALEQYEEACLQGEDKISEKEAKATRQQIDEIKAHGLNIEG